MLNIVQKFPLDICKNCPCCDPSIDRKVLYGDDHLMTNEIQIECQNEFVCKVLYGYFERILAPKTEPIMKK